MSDALTHSRILIDKNRVSLPEYIQGKARGQLKGSKWGGYLWATATLRGRFQWYYDYNGKLIDDPDWSLPARCAPW